MNANVIDPEVRTVIDDLLRDNRVVLFMKGNRTQPQCGFSAKTVAALDMLLPDYVTVDVLQHPGIREGIKHYANWPTIPQLYIDGELIGGSDIVAEMFDAGDLGDALGIPGPSSGTSAATIDIEPAAGEIMSNALQSRAGMAIHLKIDAGFEHSLSLAPPKPGTQAIASGPVTLHMDPWSALRADGLRIRVRESLQGQGFQFENPNAPPPVQPMSVQQLKAALDRGDASAPKLFDVRGGDERSLASLPAGRPWDEEAMQAIDGLPRDTPLVFYCHTGARSQSVAERYRRRGFTNVHNLSGGIDAWSREVDSTIPRY